MFIKHDDMHKVASLLIYIAQADGEITSDEIKYFDDYFHVRTGDESFFSKLSGEAGIDLYRLLEKEEVIEGLSGWSEELRVSSILDAFGLALTDNLEKIEEERLIELCRAMLDESSCALIESITGINIGCDYEHQVNEIISIGNDPEQDDIYINDVEVKGRIFYLDDRLYIFGLNSEGAILLNDSRIIFNGIVTEIKNGDFLNFGKFRLYYFEIVRRITRKAGKHKFLFSIVFDGLESKLLIDKDESIVDPDVRLNVSGNICSINIISQKVSVTSDNIYLAPGVEHYIGLDQYLVIRPCAEESGELPPAFSLDIPSLLNAQFSKERILIARTAGETRHLSNNNRAADIVFESIYTSENDKFVDICVDLDRVGTLRIVNRGYSIFLNGELVEDELLSLKTGDILQVEKEIVTFDFDKGEISNIISRIEQVDVNGLTFKYKKDDSGIDDINFSSRLGEMTCIMGPSGSGKSSLIKVMLGYQKASSGTVKLNGLDFYDNFENLKNYVGYVPQDDLLYENLTVFENLYYSGKLKLPHITDKELIDKIDELLLVLGLSEKRDKPVGSEMERTLSGGERRRLNIGLELLNDADVIYLDEPTSGLSSYDSKKIIELLKGYASRGKIIYVVIHQPAPEIFYMFDTLILLDYGGKLAYFGETENAVRYFTGKSQRIGGYQAEERPSPDHILEILQEVKRDLKGDVICENDKAGNKIPYRVCTPQNWKIMFNDYRKKNKGIEEWSSEDANPESLKYAKETFKHRMVRFKSLFMRNFRDRVKDRTSVAMAFLAPAVLVMVLAFLMRTGSAPAFIDIEDYNSTAKIILNHDKKAYYDDNVALILDSYDAAVDGLYHLDKSYNADESEKLKEIFNKPDISAIISRASGEKKSGPVEILSPAEFREILRAVNRYESEFYSFLEYYNTFDRKKSVVRHEPDPAADSKKDKNDNKDIHKIFRDADIDRYLFRTNPNFPKFLFLSVIILIFLGLTSSMNEIQKDRPKIRREKLLNIRAFDYLFGKTLTTLIFAVVQTAIYTAGALLIVEIPFSVPELGYCGFSFLACFYFISLIIMMASSMMGYYISALVQSEKTIFILIPVLIIPQIIFGGLFLEYDDMGGRMIQKDRPVPLYCDLTFSRWGYEALAAVCYNYNPKINWNKIYNRFYSENTTADSGYADAVEREYALTQKLMFNEELHSEMLSGKTKWNYFENRHMSQKQGKAFVTGIGNILESHDPFPGNIKTFINRKVPSQEYNSYILILFIFLFYYLTLSVVKKERGV